MKVVKKFESRAGFDGDLRTWVKFAPKELDMLRNGPLTATVLNCNLVYSIRMEDQHIRVARNRVLAAHTGVVELDLKSQGF